MVTELPSFLQGTEVTTEDLSFWEAPMGNGFGLQNFLSENRKSLTAHNIRAAMCIECERAKPRWYVLQRLKSALNEKLRREEDAEFLRWYQDQGEA